MGSPEKSVSAAALHLNQTAEREFELDAVLHPSRVFARPGDVIRDSGLSLAEKRAILASWASDACAIESAPTLRSGLPGGRPVSFDEVMDALRMLDGPAGEPPSMPDRRGRKVRRAPLPFEKTRIWRRFRGSDPESDPNSGIPLN